MCSSDLTCIIQKLKTDGIEFLTGVNVEKYSEEIKRFLKNEPSKEGSEFIWGQLEGLSEKDWYIITTDFFKK